MEIIKLLLLALIILFTGCSQHTVETDKHRELIIGQSKEITASYVRFLMQNGQVERAFHYYRIYKDEIKGHDFELLQQLCEIILKRGSQKRDFETELLTIYGAGISSNEMLLNILLSGIGSPYLDVQLSALRFLFYMRSDIADEFINKAMASSFLITRLEAAYYLSLRKHQKSLGQIEALMQKMPIEAKHIFPELIASIDSPRSSAILKGLLTDSDKMTQISAILSAGHYKYYDLLPNIRNLSKRLNFHAQEACAISLGMLGDRKSLQVLKKITHSQIDNVKLAALYSLYQLGELESKEKIEEMAKSGDTFAINLLANIPGSEDTLAKLLKNSDSQVKINSAVSLLKRGDLRCLNTILEMLTSNPEEILFTKQFSNSSGMNSWKAITVLDTKSENFKYEKERSLGMLEDLLKDAFTLPEEHFLHIARTIFKSSQKALIPTLINLLENLCSEGSITLLKEGEKQFGAPLIRKYCSLALFRMDEEGQENQIKQWIENERQNCIIRFRPMIFGKKRAKESISLHKLTPEEKSRLLIESFKTLAIKQNEYAIDILIKTIEQGNEKNRYALAGLLLLAIE